MSTEWTDQDECGMPAEVQMTDTQPQTETGRHRHHACAHVQAELLNLRAEAATPISRERLAAALRKIDFDHDRDMLDNPEAEAERRKTADAILAALGEQAAPSEPSDRLRSALLKECDDARNTGIRPSKPDELRAWNFVIDHFEQFVRNWKPAPAEAAIVKRALPPDRSAEG